MSEINLLPDELRGKEGKELENVRKNIREEKIEMVMPSKNKPSVSVRPSFFSRLFGSKKKILKSAEPLKPQPSKAVPIVPVKELPKSLLSTAEKPKLLPLGVPAKPKTSFFSRYFSSTAKASKPVVQQIKPLPPKPAPVAPKIEVPMPPAVKEIKKEPEKIMSLMPKPPVTPVKPLPPKLKKDGWFARWRKRKQARKSLKKIESREKPRTKPAKIEKFSFLDVNLMPAELAGKSEMATAQKIVISGMLIVITLLALVGAYLGLTWYQLKQTRENQIIRDQISALDLQISKAKEQSMAAFALRDKLVSIRELLNQHVYWTQFFSDLEKYTLPDVYYTNFSMSGQDKLVISAMGKDYNSVAGQLSVFQQAKDFVKAVSINSAAATLDKSNNYNGVSFNINLEFASGIFSKSIQ